MLFNTEFYVIHICITRWVQFNWHDSGTRWLLGDTWSCCSSPTLPFGSDWFKTWREIIFQRAGLISVFLSGISVKCAPHEPLKLPPGDQTAALVTEFTSAPLYFLWIRISLQRHSKWVAGKVSGCFKRRSWWDLDVLFSADALNSLLGGQTLFGPFFKPKEQFNREDGRSAHEVTLPHQSFSC